MDAAFITAYITTTFDHVQTSTNYGYEFFFYNTERKLPFATLAASDNEYDSVSQLDRPGVFRLNIGVSKPTFQALFGTERVDPSAYDFTALDTIMPHPDYAPQSWICVLSPSDATFQQGQHFLAEAYGIAARRFNRRTAE